MGFIKLSIITINRNNAAGLEKTLLSINAQTCKDFEHIIIDGASDDGSVDVIKKYDDGCVERRWISEPDKGIYNAMNKGIRMAKGEYIQILNSGDCLYEDVVVEQMLCELKLMNESHDKIDSHSVALLQANMMKKYASYLIRDKGFAGTKPTMLSFIHGTINHNPVYIKRSLFDKYGYYDETLKVVSDYKWYLQVVILNNEPLYYVDIDLTTFDMYGISETNMHLREQERIKVLQELIPQNILIDYVNWNFNIEQIQRLKKHPIIYKIFWIIERCLFKVEKINHKRNIIRRKL